MERVNNILVPRKGGANRRKSIGRMGECHCEEGIQRSINLASKKEKRDKMRSHSMKRIKQGRASDQRGTHEEGKITIRYENSYSQGRGGLGKQQQCFPI